MSLKVDDVLQQMKTRCRNELALVLAISEEELVKLHNTEWNEHTKQLVSTYLLYSHANVECTMKDPRFYYYQPLLRMNIYVLFM